MSKRLTEIRETVKKQLVFIDKNEHPYAEQIITLNLQMAEKEFGKPVAVTLIEEFKLEKYGWKKDSKEIRRMGKYDFDGPVL